VSSPRQLCSVKIIFLIGFAMLENIPNGLHELHLTNSMSSALVISSDILALSPRWFIYFISILIFVQSVSDFSTPLPGQ